MKTANCALIADISKFEAPMERAKTQVSSLGKALQGIGKVAQVTSSAFDAIATFSSKINSIGSAFNSVRTGIENVKGIAGQMPAVFNAVKTAIENVKSVAGQIPAVFTRITSAVAKISPRIAPLIPVVIAVGVAVGALAVATYALGKAFQLVGNIASKTFSLMMSGLQVVGKTIAGAGSALSSGFKTALSAVGSVASKTIGVIAGLGISLGALDHFFKIGIMSAIELGDQYETLNKRTGASIPFLYDFGKILKNNGMDASTAGTAILALQRSLSGVNELGQPTNDMIKRLGLNFEELNKKSPDEATYEVLVAISKLGSETEKTRATFEMFGRSGMALKAVLKDENFSKLGGNFSESGKNLAKNAGNFSKISAELRDSGSFFRDFFVSLGGEVAPSVLELFKMFSSGSSMLSGFGTELGKRIRFGADILLGAFKSGMIFETLQIAFETAGVILKDIFTRTISFASDQLGNAFQAVVGTSMLSGIGEAIIGSFSIISGGLLKAFSTPLAYFAAGIQTALENALDYFAKTFPKTAEMLGMNAGETGGGMESNFAEQKKMIGGFADSTMSAGFDSVKSGIADAVAGAKESLGSLQQIIAKFPPESEEAKNALADFNGKMAAIAVASGTSRKALDESGGQGFLVPKEGGAGKGMSGAAVSSLQRIGGGGGAFGGDPLVNAMAKQTKAVEENTKAVNAQKPKLFPTANINGVPLMSSYE